MSARPPYDPIDESMVRAYMARRGLRYADPLGAEADPTDIVYASSLRWARETMAAHFGKRVFDVDDFRLFPAFYVSPQPNALAVDLDGVHLCAMSTGLVILCYELAMFQLSRPEFMPGIGNQGAEVARTIPAHSLLALWHARRVPTEFSKVGAAGPITPNDPERRAAAHELITLMLQFVWLHELAHCLRGHAASHRRDKVARGNSSLDELALVEVGFVSPFPFWRRLRRDWELMADADALAMLLKEVDCAQGCSADGSNHSLVMVACVMTATIFDRPTHPDAVILPYADRVSKLERLMQYALDDNFRRASLIIRDSKYPSKSSPEASPVPS